MPMQDTLIDIWNQSSGFIGGVAASIIVAVIHTLVNKNMYRKNKISAKSRSVVLTADTSTLPTGHYVLNPL